MRQIFRIVSKILQKVNKAELEILKNIAKSELKILGNYFISLFSFESNEPGDLNFGQYEIINVIETNGDWYTGQIDDLVNRTKINGIFPSNYVKKFDFPIEYLQKFNIAIAIQDYTRKSNEEVSLRVHDLIAITQLSPDNQWSYGEVVVSNCWSN